MTRRNGGQAERVRRTFVRLCGGWSSRAGRFAGVRLTLPGFPALPAPVSAPTARHARAAETPRGRTGANAPVTRGGAETVHRLFAAGGAADAVRELASTVPAKSNGIPSGYGLRRLAGATVPAKSNGIPSGYGLRGLAWATAPAKSNGIPIGYGLRGLTGAIVPAKSNGIPSGYGLRRLAGAIVPAKSSRIPSGYGLRGLAGATVPAKSNGIPRGYGLRGLTGAIVPAKSSGIRSGYGLRGLVGATVPAKSSRIPSGYGLRGLAGVKPPQSAPVAPGIHGALQYAAMPQPLWSTPLTPPRIPSPAAEQAWRTPASTQVQVYVTNNCKIETPVDYETVWDKLEDALRESLNVVAAGR